MKNKFLLFALGCMFATGAMAQTKLTLQLDKAEKTVSPLLYGLMTEEINYSYEGGLYAQLLGNPAVIDMANQGQGRGQNRGDGGMRPRPAHWELTDSTAGRLTVDRTNAMNKATPQSLSFNTNADGVGVKNDGFWGIPIRPLTTYKGSVWLRAESGADAQVCLRSKDGKTVYASADLKGIGTSWKKFEYTLTTAKDVTPTKDAEWVLVPSKKGQYWLTRSTLFPPCFNNREKGLRADLMQMMKDMNPKFLRFPGGNYLEGNLFKERFDWKKMIGDPDERPGHACPWGYTSTDGMGLLEFLEWAEDVGAEPLVGIFAGYVLRGDYVVGPYLEPFIQDALDEIEYVMGGTDTKWGALRAKHGHPEPFPLHYVEIGNEDWFDRSGSYPERYRQMYDAIKAKYPQLNIIATIGGHTSMGQSMNVDGVKVDIVDEHYYRNAIDMYRNAFQYDSYDRSKEPLVFCGEWATREGEPTPNMNAALGDAAWMTCMERNSDIVIASCYAPLFVNVNPGGMQWTSDLIGYDALNSYGSPSYYAQVMFANHVGTKIVPIEATNVAQFSFEEPVRRGRPQDGAPAETRTVKLNQVYYSATKDAKKVYLKLANVRDTEQQVDVNLGSSVKIAKSAKKIEMKGAGPEDTNSITDPRHIVPVESKAKVGNQFSIKLAPYSIVVLVMEYK